MSRIVAIDRREQAAYFLLFLFPIAVNSVRHWASTIFTLLCLLSFSYPYWRKVMLTAWEKYLLALFAACFAAFMISNLVNGWGEKQTGVLGVEIRYLLFIPLYYMLRLYDRSARWLLLGCLASPFVLLGQALYEVEVLNQFRAMGVYKSPGLFAMYALITGSLSFATWFLYKDHRVLRWLIPCSIIAAGAALIYSGSRTTYFTVVVYGVVLAVLLLRGRTRMIFLAGIMIASVATYNGSSIVKSQVTAAKEEIAHYFALPDPADARHRHGSFGERLQMWRAAWLIYMDNPVWGTGRRNFSSSAKPYMERGLVAPVAAQHPHPHSAYFEMLAANGSVGFVLLLALLLYPLYFFMRAYKHRSGPALFGIMFSTAFVIYSINDAAPFIYGNFLSTYLVFLGAFFAWNAGLSVVGDGRRLSPSGPVQP